MRLALRHARATRQQFGVAVTVHSWTALGIPPPEEMALGRIVYEIRGETRNLIADRLERDRMWTFTVTWTTLEHNDFHTADVLADILGDNEFVNLPYMGYRQQRGGGTGLPRVANAAVRGRTSLVTKNWTGTQPYLKPGDFFGLATTTTLGIVNSIYRVTSMTGNTVSFQPGLRFIAVVDQALQILGATSPTGNLLSCTVELDDPSSVGGRVVPSPFPQFFEGLAMSFREARRPEFRTATGAPGEVPVLGTLAATGAIDTAVIPGKSIITGMFSATGAPDIAAAIGGQTRIGTLAATGAPDIAAFPGVSVVVGTMAANEAPNIAALAGVVIVQGTLAATGAPDAAAIAGGTTAAVAFDDATLWDDGFSFIDN